MASCIYFTYHCILHILIYNMYKDKKVAIHTFVAENCEFVIKVTAETGGLNGRYGLERVN